MTIAPGESARPALALVNSRRNEPAGPIDELASPAAMRAWLADHGLETTSSPFAPAGSETRDDDAALVAMRELRDAVRELLVARIDGHVPDPAVVETINAAAAAAPTVRRLTWSDTPREARDHVGIDGATRARALLANDAIDLVTGPDHAALRACAAPGCVRLLLKDHPRRHWCSTRCGDRVRASRYYQRHRGLDG